MKIKSGLWRLFVAMITLSLIFVACLGEGEPPTWWAGSLVRDVDTTGKEYHVVYVNTSTTIESQSLQIFAKRGSWLWGQVTYGKQGNQSTEFLQVKGPNAELRDLCSMEQTESSERVLDIIKAKLSYNYCTDKSGATRVSTKNEIKFLYPGILRQDENFKAESYYTIPTDENGYPLIEQGVADYDVVYGDNLVLSDSTFRPYYAVIDNGLLGGSLHANWAGENEGFDAAQDITRKVFDSLRAHDWQGLDPQYGTLRLSVYNPLGLGELLNLQSPIYGAAWYSDGARVDYRIKPVYVVLDTNLYRGYAKANTQGLGASLQSLLWQIKTPGSDPQNEASWTTVAGFHAIKGRFAANGLYVFRRYAPGEDYTQVVESLKQAMDRDIPKDLLPYLDSPITLGGGDSQGDALKRKIELFVYSRKPFNLADFVRDYNLEVAAVVTYADISDYVTEWTVCGSGENAHACSYTYNATPRTQMVWDIATSTNGVDFANNLLGLSGEPAVEAFAMDYIQKGQGDGTGIIFAALRTLAHYQDDTMGYADTYRLDQRSPSSPEQIDAAMKDVFGGAFESLWVK